MRQSMMQDPKSTMRIVRVFQVLPALLILETFDQETAKVSCMYIAASLVLETFLNIFMIGETL
jgi:hypothetical protein